MPKFEVEISKANLQEFKKRLLAIDYCPTQLKDNISIFKKFFFSADECRRYKLKVKEMKE
jgi:hypothetical protein